MNGEKDQYEDNDEESQESKGIVQNIGNWFFTQGGSSPDKAAAVPTSDGQSECASPTKPPPASSRMTQASAKPSQGENNLTATIDNNEKPRTNEEKETDRL